MFALALTLLAAGALAATAMPEAPAAPTPRSQAPQLRGLERYAEQLLAALALLDAGDPRAAAERFEAAGLEAPYAPVWRVHAGVARALSGESDAARAHFVAALEAGYPRDDLTAIAEYLDLRAAAHVAALDAAAQGAVSPVRALTHNAERAAQPPSAAALGAWRTVARLGHAEVPFSALARDHGDVLEIRYDAARHTFVDPDTLAVVARLAPPRPAGLGYMIGPAGERTPLPDPHPIWVGPTGDLLDQRRFRALANAIRTPRLEGLTRGLRTGLWLASAHGIRQIECAAAQPLVTFWLETPSSDRSSAHHTTARLDFARWQLLDVATHAVPARPERQPSELVRVLDAVLRKRVFELTGLEGPGDPEGTGRDTREVWQCGPDGGLLAFTAEHRAPDFGTVFLLDGNATRVRARIELPGVAEEWLAPDLGVPVAGGYEILSHAAPPPGVQIPPRHIAALAASTTPDRVFGLLLDSGTLAWTHVGSSHDGAPRELSVRGQQLYCHGGQSKAEVLDLGFGELLFDATTIGLHALDQVAGSRWPLGLGQDSAVVLHPGSFAPLASVWLHDASLVVVLEDGTFTLDSDALAEALVAVGDTRVPAKLVAPWLLDPLHIRALAHDTDPSARRFPVR